jgi:hypothetical protein
MNVAMDSNDGFDEFNNRGSNNTYGLNAELQATDQLLLGTTFSHRSRDEADKIKGFDRFDVYGRYTVGKTVFAASYERMESQDYSDQNVPVFNEFGFQTGEVQMGVGTGKDIYSEAISLQALHNFSESLSAYYEIYYVDTKSDAPFSSSEITSMNIGAKYSF